MSDIRQQTNLDFIGDIIPKTIHTHGTTLENVPYRTIDFGGLVSKFGYCINDNQGLNYPIFICSDESDNIGKEFQIGKTGMFEIQEEELPDGSVMKVYIAKILVCTLVPFVVDYFIS